ncbi:MAG: hypothetical protein K1X66_02440 [Verrucomicrobiae bacterium]|nr:hypothetical protein [Verrucomicrobiae bacterium]
MQDSLTEPRSLHNQRRPNVEIKSEKPEHRIMLYLKAQGLSNKEIAKKTNYKESWVSQVTRQEWFRKALLDELKEEGSTKVKKLLANEAINSIMKVVELRDSASSEKVQMSCAMDLIDRHFGKAAQKVEKTNEHKFTFQEVTKVDAKIEMITKRINELSNGANIGHQQPAGGRTLTLEAGTSEGT